MVTYNHKQYVAEAIESVLMQQCDFAYKLIIAEDCSTDGTREICESYQSKYPDRVQLLDDISNLGLVKNYQRVFNACTTPYIALLEGDDFWTEAGKLQEQINILEADTEIGLVHTRCYSLYQNGDKKTNYNVGKTSLQYFHLYELIMKGEYSIVPLTVCFRREIFIQYIDLEFCIDKNLRTIDAFLWPEFAMHSKIAFIDATTGCYRIVNSSVSNSNDLNKIIAFNETSRAIAEYYLEKYPLKNTLKKNVISKDIYFLVDVLLKNDKIIEAKEWSKKLHFVKLKYCLIWLILRLPFLIPLFKLKYQIIKLGSIIKQGLLRYIKAA